MDKELSILVLSCDTYSDLWNDFFNLRDLYWPDTTIKWYLVTEYKDFQRDHLQVIKCGSKSWSSRFRNAVKVIETQYIGVFLDDYFIESAVDSTKIMELVSLMRHEHVTYINMGDMYNSIVSMPNKKYFCSNLIQIPNHKKYGISMMPAIWDRDFLLSKLGDGDYSAWQFEIDRCKEAESESGLGGMLLCDENKSFNVSKVPIVIQGKFYPAGIQYYKRKGYIINTRERDMMSYREVMIYNLKVIMSRIHFLRKPLKWLAKNVFRINFFTDN